MLDFSWSIAEGYDSNVPAELQGIGPAKYAVSGGSTMFLGHMDYRWQGSRVRLAASGESAVRRYDEVRDFIPLSYSGGVDLSARLGGRTSFQAHQTAAYSPSYLYGLFPSLKSAEVAVPVAPDYAVSDSESYIYGSTVTLTRDLSRRNRVSATGEFQYTNFLHQSPLQRDLHSTAVGGEFSRKVAPNMAIQVGYRYRTGTFGYGAGPVAMQYGVSATEHGVTVGLDYTRRLSAARQLSLSFEIGPSAVSVPASSVQQVDAGHLYRASGDVAVGWNFSGSWTTRATYSRGLEYIADLTEPVFAEGVTAEIGGLCTSRVDIVASARYSSGASAVYRDALTFDTSSADVRIRYAITSTLAVYGEYLYYYYDLRGHRQLAPGIPPGLERNAVRAGLTLWVRALRR
jgi:hypothetical protein